MSGGAGELVVRALVWVDAWQQECCGDPFAIGDGVTWPLESEPDREWLQAALTPELASRVGFWQERHAEAGAEPQSRTGTVVGVRAAFGRYAAREGDGAGLYPVPGSAVLVDLARAAGFESVPSGERLNGYVVELELGEPAGG